MRGVIAFCLLAAALGLGPAASAPALLKPNNDASLQPPHAKPGTPGARNIRMREPGTDQPSRRIKRRRP